MTRIRSRDSTADHQVSVEYFSDPSTYNSDVVTTNVRTDSMTDTVTPLYFTKKRKGELFPINEMSQEKFSHVSNSGTTTWTQKLNGVDKIRTVMSGELAMAGYYSSQGWYKDPATGLWVGLPAWPSDGPVSVEALANARAKGMDLGTALAELGKTVAMIKKFRDNVYRRANSIAESLVKRNRNKFHTHEKALSAFSETWLEGRYGWRTLAYELEDLTIALIKLDDLVTRRVRGYAVDENRTEIVGRNGSYPLVKPAYKTTVSNSALGWVTIQQNLSRTKRSGSIIDAVLQGLAFVDPLITTYEVIPYSFIFDWFVNLNDNLVAFSPFAVSRRLGSWISAQEKVETVIDMTPLLTSGAPYEHSLEGTLAYHSVSTRETYTRYPVDPSFSLTFDLNLDMSKVLDIASIAFLKHARLMKELRKTTRV